MGFLVLLFLSVSCRGEATFFNDIINAVNKNFTDYLSMIPNSANLAFGEKCYEDTGCFYNGPPFFSIPDRPISLLPSNNIDSQFYLFTRNNTVVAQELNTTRRSIIKSSLNHKHKVVVIIHGFLAKLGPTSEPYLIKDALLKHYEVNVIIVDWTNNNGPFYPQAMADGRVVGAKCANVLKAAMQYKKVKAEEIYIIGHSLGAHVAGWAGERVKGIGRITGLDPAGPFFTNAPPVVRLDTTDALFVDVIHTSAGDIFPIGFGLYEAIGNMDFFPNGGNFQPGCGLTIGPEGIVGLFTVETIVYLIACSHSSAWFYMLDSINYSPCFLAVWCNSYNDFNNGLCQPQNSIVSVMGYPTKKLMVPPMSRFYLKTNATEPYCNQNSM